jgi:hypothetical protein
MAAIDERARREQGKAFELLTRGRARLQRPLLRVLWADSEYAPHQDKLLELMTRFGLVIPVPGADDEFLVPALLRDAPSLVAPAGASVSRDAACMRIFCHLDGQDPARAAAVYEENELSAGFLPIGAFHRLCAGALGSSAVSSMSVAQLERRMARVNFNKEHVILRYEPEQSSVLVHMSTDGRNGSAALVADQLRVLLCEEFGAYVQLRYHLLVPVPNRDGWYADIDKLAKLDGDVSAPVGVRGELVEVAPLKASLSHWWTSQCSFYLIDADALRAPDTAMIPLQELQTKRPASVCKKLITMPDVIARVYEGEYLAVSHRWETPAHPDPTGAQAAALRAYLKQHPVVKYVFLGELHRGCGRFRRASAHHIPSRLARCCADYMSLPQGERTPAEKTEFAQMLANINLLYLGCRVLVLMDRQYSGRFWTSFEVRAAWLPRAAPPFTAKILRPSPSRAV